MSNVHLDILHLVTAMLWATLIAFNGALVVRSEPYVKFLMKNSLERKPFNCPMCFTFWLTLLFALVTTDPHLAVSAGYAAFIADEIDRRLHTY